MKQCSILDDYLLNSSVVKCPPSNWKVGCSITQPLSELPYHSLGKSVHLNRPGKKHNSGFGLPPIAVTKKIKISTQTQKSQ